MPVVQASPIVLLLCLFALCGAAIVLDLETYSKSTKTLGMEQSDEILQRLKSCRNFTIEGVVNFAPRTERVDVSIKAGDAGMRLAGLEIRPAKKQLVVHFHRDGRAYRKIVYYLVEPDVDQYIMTVFHEDEVTLFVNSARIYNLAIGPVDRKLPENRWVTGGRVAKGRGTSYKGARVSNLRLYTDFSPGGVDQHNYAKQMGDMERELKEAKESITSLKSRSQNYVNQILRLNKTVQMSKAELTTWNGCECLRHCYHDGKQRRNGTTWQFGDKDCTCINGETRCKCRRFVCGDLQALYSVPNKECPQCRKDCESQNGIRVFHNTSKVADFGSGMKNCSCLNGLFTQCEDVINTTVIVIDSEGSFSCALCHELAACNGTACNCKLGFKGDGQQQCSDIDECSPRPPPRCQPAHNKRCINTVGSYRCECKPGYRDVKQLKCVRDGTG